jgi:hypothetical protein
MLPVSRRTALHHRAPPFILAAVLASGCAVQHTRDGKLHVSIDEAELLGTTLHVFRLADQSQGMLRRLGPDYSVKLQRYQRVIPIQKATAVAFFDARPVGGRDLLVLAKSERNCAHKTQIMAIRGAEVSGWDFGDCKTVPVVTYAGDTVYFDFAERGRPVRYTYHDGKLMRGEPLPGDGRAGLSGSANPAFAFDAGMPRYAPPPAVALGQARLQAKPTPVPAAQPRPAPRRKPSPPADNDIKFRQQEQKATITLILEDK